MKTTLQKLLIKKGIKDTSELNDEEKAIFENWNKVLSKEELSVNDIREFCQNQIDVINGKWKDLNLENSRKAEMIPYFTVYQTLLQAINSPKAIREQLEKHLNQLLIN